jgi:hypothetical protein
MRAIHSTNVAKLKKHLANSGVLLKNTLACSYRILRRLENLIHAFSRTRTDRRPVLHTYVKRLIKDEFSTWQMPFHRMAISENGITA